MRPLAIGCLVAGLALSGCGGLKKGGLTPVGNEEGTQPPAEAQDNARVEMVGIAFVPQTIRIRPGGNVTWTNKDKVPHTVTVGTELYNTLNSGEIEPGKRYTREFNGRPEKIGYRCTIHPNMQGTIFVKDD